jgi:hypothetical protein
MNLTEHIQDYTDSEHPSAEQLNAFALGQLDDGSSAKVERHVADCQVCGKMLETSPDDSLVALFQEAHASTNPSGEAAPPVSPSRPLRFVRGYQLLEVLGEGGMGVIWKARQEGLDRFVALKRIRSTGQPSSEALARFRREAEAVARLRHPNIVQIYDVGETAREISAARRTPTRISRQLRQSGTVISLHPPRGPGRACLSPCRCLVRRVDARRIRPRTTGI